MGVITIAALQGSPLLTFLALSQPPETPSKPLIKPLEDNGEGEYVASRHSDVYHHKDSYYAERILEENQVWFKSAEDAGFRKSLRD